MRIKSKKVIKLDTPVPVYDVTVEGTHNFQLDSGVFVHNSKDVADSMAAVAFMLTTYASRLHRAVIKVKTF